MAILKNIEMWWVKLDPKKPAAAFGDGGPKWEFQARTKSKEQMQEWKAAGLNPKAVREDKEDDTSPFLYWKTSFRKPITKKDGSAMDPVIVTNGALKTIDPNTIGNGSICNVRVFQKEYEMKDKKTGAVLKKGTSNMLMQVQVTKHIKYVPTGEEMDMCETEEIDPSPQSEEEDMGVDSGSTGDAQGEPTGDDVAF
jgi:hypothetical protein